MTLRICDPSDFGVFHGVEDEAKCTFRGQFGSLLNDYLQPLLRHLNLTCKISADLGFGELSQSEEQYSGCLGNLQKNKSDIVIQLGDYPMDIVNVSQGDVVLDTKVVFAQDYYQVQRVEKLQILSALKSIVPILPYIILYFTSVLLVFMISRKVITRLGYALKRRSLLNSVRTRNQSMSLLAHALRFGSIRGDRPHARVLFLSVSIFSLVIVHFILCSIKTDLVVALDPKKWLTYDDLMTDKVEPIFIQELSVKEHFKHARGGTVERKLWEYTVNNFHSKDARAKDSLKIFTDVGGKMVERKAALLVDEIIAELIGNLGCRFRMFNLSRWMPQIKDADWRNRNFFIAVQADPSSKSIIKGLLYSKFFADEAQVNLRKYAKWGLQMGLAKEMRSRLVNNDVAATLRLVLVPSGASYAEVKECLSGKPARHEMKVEKSILFENTVTLFLTCATFIAIAFIVLSFEVIHYEVHSFLTS